MAQPPAPLPPEVVDALKRRQPIEAIRLLLADRTRTAPRENRQPGGLAATPKKRTPTSVESVTSDSGLSPGEVPSSSSTFWGWTVVALFAYLAYRLLQG